MKWDKALLQAGKEIMIRGGKVELIVYKRQNKRKPLIRKYPDCEINCEEEEIVE